MSGQHKTDITVRCEKGIALIQVTTSQDASYLKSKCSKFFRVSRGYSSSSGILQPLLIFASLHPFELDTIAEDEKIIVLSQENGFFSYDQINSLAGKKEVSEKLREIIVRDTQFKSIKKREREDDEYRDDPTQKKRILIWVQIGDREAEELSVESTMSVSMV